MNSQKNMEKVFQKEICNIFVNSILLFRMNRLWYMNEAAQESWSSRTLDRNIRTQYYYRLMQSPKKEEVMNETLQKTS